MVSGINATKYKLIAMCLSAFFTALAGSYYVFYISYLDPLLAFNIVISIEILLPAVIGGEGTILGPIVGALFIVPVSEWLRVQLGGLSGPHMMLYGATLIVVALFLPEGLWRGIKKRLSRYLSLSNV
jgi:branched-chain amino acid transport system permease protein